MEPEREPGLGLKVWLLGLTLKDLGPQWLLVHLLLGEAGGENALGYPDTVPTSPHTYLSLLAPAGCCVGGGLNPACGAQVFSECILGGWMNG